MPDPQYELGRLAQAVETLSEEVTKLRRDVGEIKGSLNRSKGFFFGMMAAAGGVGAGIFSAVSKVFGK